MNNYKSVNFQQLYRRENDKTDVFKHNRGIAIQILELAEEGKKVSEIIDVLDITRSQYRQAKCFLSDKEKRSLEKYIKINMYGKQKPLTKEEFSAYVRSRASKK